MDEEKIFILSTDNQVSSFGFTRGADLQPIINFFKRTNRVPIEEVYIQKIENTPMIVVTHLYDIG